MIRKNVKLELEVLIRLNQNAPLKLPNPWIKYSTRKLKKRNYRVDPCLELGDLVKNKSVTTSR